MPPKNQAVDADQKLESPVSQDEMEEDESKEHQWSEACGQLLMVYLYNQSPVVILPSPLIIVTVNLMHKVFFKFRFKI